MSPLVQLLVSVALWVGFVASVAVLFALLALAWRDRS
jgi:hypothetical protein